MNTSSQEQNSVARNGRAWEETEELDEELEDTLDDDETEEDEDDLDAEDASDEIDQDEDEEDESDDEDAGEKVRYAVIGMGHIAQAAILPAFANASRNSELAALISDDPDKLEELGEMYGVEGLYGYDDLERCFEEEQIDAVFIATPNSEHLEYVERAAQAGVHVLCEKPLAVTELECLDAIHACEEAGVWLMTAYRLHFEPCNLKALEVVQSGEIGEPRLFTSVFSYQIKDPENIRLRSELGGGPLHDIGIYCINAARSIFQDEPIEVQGWAIRGVDARFHNTEETVMARMVFPGDRVAMFTCSFGMFDASWYQVLGEEGRITLSPAYEYSEGLQITINAGEKESNRRYAKRDQFAAEIEYFSDCILNHQEPEPSGWEGLADIRVIRAIQQSIDRGVPLHVPPTPYVRHPQPDQKIEHPGIEEPRLVGVRSASE